MVLFYEKSKPAEPQTVSPRFSRKAESKGPWETLAARSAKCLIQWQWRDLLGVKSRYTVTAIGNIDHF